MTLLPFLLNLHIEIYWSYRSNTNLLNYTDIRGIVLSRLWKNLHRNMGIDRNRRSEELLGLGVGQNAFVFGGEGRLALGRGGSNFLGGGLYPSAYYGCLTRSWIQFSNSFSCGGNIFRDLRNWSFHWKVLFAQIPSKATFFYHVPLVLTR